MRGLKSIPAGRALGIVLLAVVLAVAAGMAQAREKAYPPLGRVTVLMAMRAVSGQSFRNPAEEIKAVEEAGHRILDVHQEELDAALAAGGRTAYEHRLMAERIAAAREELHGRAQAMIRPGGLVNVIKRGYATCKEGTTWVCSQPLRLLTDEAHAEKVARLVVTGAEYKTRIGRAITGGIGELQVTEKFLKSSLDEIARLTRELERDPRVPAVQRALQLREQCVRTCDDVNLNCQHRNCRAHPKDANCQRQCAACVAGMCEEAFSPHWAEADRAYLSCAGRVTSRYLAGLQGCVDRFIKESGHDRVLHEAECADALRQSFTSGRDACRDKSCAALCQGPYSIFDSMCFCEE